MSRYTIGQNVETYSSITGKAAYDGVIVYAEDDTQIGSAPSGSSFANPFEVVFPWNADINGDAQGDRIASVIWTDISAFTYSPFEATNALIHPAFELGDAILINGNRTIIAKEEITLDPLYTADISAPQDSEADIEYDVTTDTERLTTTVARESTYARSTLKVGLDNITARVTTAEGTLGTSLTVDEYGVVFDNNGDEVIISSGSITAVSVSADNILAGTLSAGSGSTSIKLKDMFEVKATSSSSRTVSAGYLGGYLLNGESTYNYIYLKNSENDACISVGTNPITPVIALQVSSGATETFVHLDDGLGATSGEIKLCGRLFLDQKTVGDQWGYSLPATGGTGQIFFLVPSA